MERPGRAAHIQLVGQGARKGKELSVVENGLEDHHVKQVGAIHIGIIVDQRVALLQGAGRMNLQQGLQVWAMIPRWTGTKVPCASMSPLAV